MTGMLFREIGSPSAKGPQLNKSTAMLEGVRYIQLRVRELCLHQMRC
jgi:hypothetical protein